MTLRDTETQAALDDVEIRNMELAMQKGYLEQVKCLKILTCRHCAEGVGPGAWLLGTISAWPVCLHSP